MVHVRKLLIGLLLALALLPSPVAAQVCSESELQSSLQYLRRLSIDLQGTVPDVDTLQEVVQSSEVPHSLIDAFLESESFILQMRKYHLDLLWTNIAGQRFSNGAWLVRSPRNQDDTDAMWVRANARSSKYRGAQIPCTNEPAQFDTDGNILTTPHPENSAWQQEGYVEVEPWWAPGTTVKVCAFDAQTALTAPNPSNNNPDRMADCSQQVVAGCGCGENLRWCQSDTPNTSAILAESMNEQMLRMIDNVIREDRPYTDVILRTEAEINGPMSHWLRFQTQTGGNAFIASDQQNHDVPVIAGDAVHTWQAVQRYDRHAGVLTLPGYLVKFQTDRARANRFHNAFLCQSFQAPEGGLPAADDTCNDEPDLQVRCGCKYCHAMLEPDAAHWGRFAESGLSALNEDIFPAVLDDCQNPNNNSRICRLFYLQPDEATHEKLQAYVGSLYPYVYQPVKLPVTSRQGNK